MRKHRFPILLLLLLAGIAFADRSYAKTKGETGRLLTGKVVDHQGSPIPDAVVYLSDTRTRGVKTFIVGPELQRSAPGRGSSQLERSAPGGETVATEGACGDGFLPEQFR
jgi:hypothetical protein